MLNMSAILLENTFQTLSPFIDTAIKELLRHSCTIACFSCSTVSNSHRNTLAAAGLPTLRNLPGSSLDCLLVTSQAL